MDFNATVPAKTIKSDQETVFPYFCFIGHNNYLALSRLTLSGQLPNGEKRICPRFAPPLPSKTLYVPELCQESLIKNGP